MAIKTLNALVTALYGGEANVSASAPTLSVNISEAPSIKYATVPTAGFYNAATGGNAITSIGVNRSAYLRFTVSSADAGAVIEITNSGWENWPPSNGSVGLYSNVNNCVLPNATMSSARHTDVSGFTTTKYLITINQAITSNTEFVFHFSLNHSSNANRTSEKAYLSISNNDQTLQQKMITVTQIGL